MNIQKPMKFFYKTLLRAKKYVPQRGLIFDYNPSSIKNNSTSLISSVNTGNNGILQNSVVVSSNPPLFDFNGSNNYISTSTQYNNPSTNTISFWFRTNVASGNKIIGFENGQTGEGTTAWDRMLYVGTDGKLYFGIYNSGTYYINTSYRVTDNKFRHVVLTTTNNSQNLYVDDVLIGSQTIIAQNYSGYWRIGAYKANGWSYGSDGYFDGQIGTIQLYDRVLSRTEITQNYQTGKSTYGNNVSFSYTGFLQKWVVPSNVYSLTINAIGARGGSGWANTYTGGYGANIICNVSVTPGQTLFIVVGGYPGVSKTPLYGFGGNGGVKSSTSYGGAGGGLSGIFTGETPSINNALVVAGGGGGSGGGYTGNQPCYGGSAGQNQNGQGNDGSSNGAYTGVRGKGGTNSYGGAAGSPFDGNTVNPTAGNFLQGGNGGWTNNGGWDAGGGGGAGYYAGGGGAAGGFAVGGGGGGGTFGQSYTIFGQQNDVGHGSVTIYYNKTNNKFDSGFRYHRWRISDTRDSVNTSGCQASEFVFQDEFGNDQRMYVKNIYNPDGANNSGQEVTKLIDGNLSTKWYDYNFQANNKISFVLFDYGAEQKRNYNFYRWATGNDVTGRDPKSWVLEVSNDQVYWWITDYVYDYTATTERQTWQTARALSDLGNPNNLVKFIYTGSISEWTVPAGVSRIYVNLVGATGENGVNGVSGGGGAQISTTLTVTPQTTLYIVVGGKGNGKTASFGYGGNGGENTGVAPQLGYGGAGGGLSGIFTGNTPSINNALAVAGGGGGGGGGSGALQPCQGGDAGANRNGQGNNGNSNNGNTGTRGKGGTNTYGGDAGTPYDVNTVNPSSGTDLQGGNGGWTNNGGWNGGGGGGGGYYAGGGGAAGGDYVAGGGGGGTYSIESIIWNDFNTSGDGWITISY